MLEKAQEKYLMKSDGTPVTEGDHKVDKYIYKKLKEINQNIPIISEEREKKKDPVLEKIFWIN